MKTVIYKIENLLNSDCYIGSTTNYSRRTKRHFEDLKLNKHHSIKLQRAVNKYGVENFRVYILESFEFISKEYTLEREQYYIDTIKPKYNVCLVAGSQLGTKRDDCFKKACSKRMLGHPAWNKGKKSMTEYQKIQLSIGRKNGKKREMTEELINKIINKVSKPVLQYNIDGTFIKEWNSLKEVSINLPCSHAKLSEYLNGKSNIDTFKNFIWKFKI